MNKLDIEAVAMEISPTYQSIIESPAKRVIRDRAKAAIAALDNARAERGRKDMPREPTQAMLNVPVQQRPITKTWNWPRSEWQAMYDAHEGEDDG